MKTKVCTILLVLFALQVSLSSNVPELKVIQEIDSLLEAGRGKVYENPDESIKLGLSIYENNLYTQKNRIRGLILVSLAYTSKRDYQKALEYATEANNLSSEIDDQKLQIEILFKIGILYQQLKIYDKSLEYIEKTEQLSSLYPPQDPTRKYLANSYAVKGFIYKENLNCDIALEFFNKSIREYKSLGSAAYYSNLSIVNYNKGNCYSLLSEYNLAKESFEKAISYAKLEEANSLISFAQKGLAEVYLLEGQYKTALLLLEDALKTSSKVGDLILNQGIYKGLFENHLALNNWESYQKYYDLYLKTQLEIKKSERNSINTSINENYKNQEAILKASDVRFKNTIKWIFSFIILVVLAVFLLERKNKKTIKTLQKRIKDIQNTKPASNV
ncbi:tetratricopeptide repeat protein [Mangrovimonas spongiae]|uniref:Tetratricopeptide repeat protein n=1 Tax=Mangrovimonas spongiae TaxID=2494697 RepID=A0A3R9UTM8_9FLAO|nr:tetratricopeptide repeat protein [Mangrovimonas spongiae]RSK39851.1 tetratricopeptide repeat protein [Mangrovimonas spongiae]